MTTDLNTPVFPAQFTVHTPSGPTNTCEDHRAKLKSLMQFMGAWTNVTDAPEGSTCKNCENEHKAGKR